MALIHLNEEGFEKALSTGVPMLVDFWATWCTHCKPLGPIFEQLGEEYEGKNVLIGKVDVDEAPAVAVKYGIMGVPTVILIQNGQEVDRKVGGMPYDVYTEMLDAALDGDAN